MGNSLTAGMKWGRGADDNDAEAQQSLLGAPSLVDTTGKEPEPPAEPEVKTRKSMTEHEAPLISQVRQRWAAISQQEFLDYCRRFLCVGFWCCLLILNFWWNRLFVTSTNLPNDGEAHEDAYDIYYSLNHMLLYGVVLGWFAGITEPARAQWLFHWERWYFYVLFFGASPIYSLISNAKGLQHSFEDIDEWSGAMWTAIILATLVAGAVVIWHLYFAFKKLSPYGMALYLILRIIVIMYYWMFAILVQDTHHSDVHWHHYFTSWTVALFGEFNHPLSVMLLSVMSSVFVQGIASYGFDPLFNDETCKAIRVENYGMCTYNAKGDFKMTMCPGKDDEVTVQCFTRRQNDLSPVDDTFPGLFPAF